MKQLTQARVDSGQELAHESKKANVAEQDAAYRAQMLDRDLGKAERALGMVLVRRPGCT